MRVTCEACNDRERYLLRDVSGNPFRPTLFSPEWRTGIAVALAKQVYDSRDFSAMPILADALQVANNAYNLIFLGLALALLVAGLKVLPPDLSVYSLLLILPPTLFGTPQGPLMGLPRYVLVAFPLFIVLGVLLRDRRALGGWLAASTAFSLLLCALFVSWRFVA